MNPAPQSPWQYVYVLNSAKTDGYYVGCTSNLDQRVDEHARGKVFTTKKMLPVELVYFEAYKTKQQAYEREKSLKQYGSSYGALKRRLGGAG